MFVYIKINTQAQTFIYQLTILGREPCDFSRAAWLLRWPVGVCGCTATQLEIAE